MHMRSFKIGLRQIPYLVGGHRDTKMAHTELGLRKRRTIEYMLNVKTSLAVV
ncbi:hypothetical protein P775_26190 [Puniceibacterium antarcticum]|uniref:Uncharacterized protein n=1 Tax=Puniceibacterium antarcticum TaxID=1206336 RepID=A0A2G8R075_9RHOB|nr:hypothetical protein P775_26190 [Puniceibacterium antarcticum]